MKASNIFASMPEELSREVFDVLLQKGDVKIERIVSRGHVSAQDDWYDQAWGEWVMILQGAAIILFENNEEVSMAVGSHLTIPAGMKHRVKWTEPDTETVWLAVHYGCESETL